MSFISPASQEQVAATRAFNPLCVVEERHLSFAKDLVRQNRNLDP